MKVAILLCFVACVFGTAPVPVPAPVPGPVPTPVVGGVPCPTPAVQAAPFAAPALGGPVPFGAPVGAPLPLPPVPVNPALMAKLKPRVDQWTTTYTSGNAETFTTMFDTEAVIYPDHDFAYYGRTGAKKWQTKNKAANILTTPIQIMDIMEAGAYTYMRGNMRDARGTGDVMMIWTDVNGQLLLKYLTYNWDTPTVPTQYDPLGTTVVKQKVMTRMTEWQKLYETGDIETLSQMYTEMCKVFPVSTFKTEGREGARKVYQDLHDHGITKTTYMVMEAEQVADTITAWMYCRDYKGTEMYDEGTKVMVFKEVNGQLMIQYDTTTIEWMESNRTTDEKLAQEFYNEWDTLFSAGNMPALVAKYEPNAVRMMSGMPLYTGVPAMTQQLQTDFNSGNRHEIEVFTAMTTGDYMFVVGRQQTLKNDMVVTEGNFVDLMRMVGGKPKLLWDTYAVN